jgi:hypothetical protein
MCSAISRRTSTCSGGRRSKKSSHASHLPFDPALAEADALLEDFARFWDEEPSPLERRKLPTTLLERVCGSIVARPTAAPVRPLHPTMQRLNKPRAKRGVKGGSDGTPGATWQDHLQLWAVRADGSGRHAVTHAFPVDYGDSAVWVAADLKGTPAPKLRLISPPTNHTLATALPIVALAAEGKRAAVAQGFGSAEDFGSGGGRLGPIVVWDAGRRTTALVPVHGCGSAEEVLLAAGGVG